MSVKQRFLLAAAVILAVLVPASPALAVPESIGSCVVEELEALGVEQFEEIVQNGTADKPTPEAKEALADTEEDLEGCLDSPNPIFPPISEIIWGALAFSVLFGLMSWKLFPAVKSGMDARSDRIRDDLAAADTARATAEREQAEYRAELDDAKNEASRIIEEARQQAETVRSDLQARAEADIAELRVQAASDVETSKAQAMSDLRGEVSDIALGAAEMVIGSSLDRDAHSSLIDDYIDQVGSRN